MNLDLGKKTNKQTWVLSDIYVINKHSFGFKKRLQNCQFEFL